ncbi:MAG: alkaline phosphatase D family protein, partial [Bacteroidota bacterium]
MNGRILFYFLTLSFLLTSCQQPPTNTYTSDWEGLSRTWVGPDFWANRLQDWELREGELYCLVSAENRNLHILTYRLGEQKGIAELSVSFQVENQESTENNRLGFLLGAKGKFKDYRDDAVRGEGLMVGVTSMGRLFIGETTSEESVNLAAGWNTLEAKVIPTGGTYSLTVSIGEMSLEQEEVAEEDMQGSIALLSDFRGNQMEEKPSVAFKDWKLSGTKLTYLPEQAYGPVLFAQHTLSQGSMKLTAQMPPMGEEEAQEVVMELERDNVWRKAATATIDPMSRTATFKMENWQDGEDQPYRLAYQLSTGSGTTPTYFEGTIRKDPKDKENIKVLGFTGNNDLGFPNNDLVENVVKQDGDLLFFSGDQIYEGVGGYGVQRGPVDKASLDYLRKWYLFGWTFRDLMRDIPSVAIPDDHDVYHGNIWGEGGKAADNTPEDHSDKQDTGGYKMPPEWVNMVQRTQTSHLPDPYDPTPVKQGITVYYTDMRYGGISFAILEDRKFKSAPRGVLPKADVRNGWIQNRNFDAKTQADATGAILLGERQLTFLEDWAADWSGGTWMKVLLSQTIFANVATLPKEEFHDRIVPTLRILEKGEYAEGDKAVADMDSNGWPQTGRDNAVKTIRKAYAFHLAGDQHLGSSIQYGVDAYGDAGYALCVPSVSNVWPRRWYPPVEGGNRPEGAPRNMGDFEDGFGNKMTVLAVSNPYFTGREPSNLYDRATGYGVVSFNRASRDITLANWERDTDPTVEGALPYEGWPITINQLDNFTPENVQYLPTLSVEGMQDPIIQVSNADTGDILYTLRIKGTEF